MKRLKIKWNVILVIAFVVLTMVFIYRMCRTSNQAVAPVGQDVRFEGQFSYDEDKWYDIGKDKMSGTYDSVVLRGKFVSKFSIPEELLLNMYSSHIIIEIFEDDTMVFRHHPTYDGYGLEMCGTSWPVWLTDILGRDKEVTIHLTNCHEYGNNSAYEEFVESFYIAPEEVLEEKLSDEYKVQRSSGLFIGIAGIVFIIILVTCVLLKVSTAGEMWIFSGIAVSMGLYIMLDIQGVNMWPNLIVFNTNVHLISLLFTALLIMAGLVSLCSGVIKKAWNVIVVFYGAIHMVVLWKVTEKKVLLWDMLKYWAIITFVLVLALLICAIFSIIKKKSSIVEKKNRKVLVFGMFAILGGTLLAELANGYMGIWDFGYALKVVYCIIFAVQLVFVAGYLIMNHGAYAKSKMLEHDLEHSRIVLSLGQIKNHFIFNVLNAISGMCKNEPEKADETIVLFSRYLRNNMAVLEDSSMISFGKVMDNLRDYIELEKIRFEEKITYREELEITNFVMPQMILQPLVENSLKHGILTRSEGGTICVKTYKEKGNVVIKVIDDGVGFDHNKEFKEESLGINNVKFRLKHMVNGKMDIKSEVGKGTVVTLTIPFKEK